MFYPIPTSSQLAQHDAWLEEGCMEPSYPVADKPVRIRSRARLVSRIGKWLIATGLRLQVRQIPKASSPPMAS